MDRRSAWVWGSLLAFAAACALIALELRGARSIEANARPEPAPLAPPKAPPSALPAPTPGTTNETLHADLQEQTDKMGIQAIGGQEQDDSAPEPFLRPGEPGSREQAEQTIRQIALLRKAVDRRAGKQDAVPIDGSVAPVLADDEGGAGGTALSGAPADRWSGSYSEADPGTRTIEDAKTWARTWRSVSKDAPPSVDFSRSEAVCVFLGERPTGGYAVDILGAQTTEDALVVQYVEHAPDPGKAAPEGATSPYAIRLIPRSDLPVRYQKLR